jgi:3-dehydroquinate dehydratase type I
MNYRIAVPFIKPVSSTNLVFKMNDAKNQGADLCEMRYDLIGRYELPKFSEDRPLKVIATNRVVEQGGKANEGNKRITTLLYNSHPDYYDIELRTHLEYLETAIKYAKGTGAKVILSDHDFRGMPTRSELDNKYSAMRDLKADICKIVGTAKTKSDNDLCLEFLRSVPEDSSIVFAMGNPGWQSRILAPLQGSMLTFGNMEGESAPGQPSLALLRTFKDIVASGTDIERTREEVMRLDTLNDFEIWLNRQRKT